MFNFRFHVLHLDINCVAVVKASKLLSTLAGSVSHKLVAQCQFSLSLICGQYQSPVFDNIFG